MRTTVFLALSGVLVAAVLAMAHGASGTPPAARAGLPAPLAADELSTKNGPVAPSERRFRYRDGTIDSDEAARRGLACIEKQMRTTCYDSEAEMEQAEGLVPFRRNR